MGTSKTSELSKQIKADFSRFVEDEYTKVKASCDNLGELKWMIKAVEKNFIWENSADGANLIRRLEKLADNEIGSALSTLPAHTVN